MDKEKIIFMDGEFAKLKPDGIDLLSIALIKPNGEELYLELEFNGEIDSWVKKNVMPYLSEKKVSKKEAIETIKKFVGNSKPYLISYVNQFDWMGICRLFDANTAEEIKEKIPFNWVPIDFGTMLFEREIKPGISLIELAKKKNIDTSNRNKHNALDDARTLKEIYSRLIK